VPSFKESNYFVCLKLVTQEILLFSVINESKEAKLLVFLSAVPVGCPVLGDCPYLSFFNFYGLEHFGQYIFPLNCLSADTHTEPFHHELLLDKHTDHNNLAKPFVPDEIQ
jgi:hypothetical protein